MRVVSLTSLAKKDPTPILKLKLSFIAHDLRTFQSNPHARARLEASVSRHNIGPPYLTESEADRALSTPLHAFRLFTCNLPKHYEDDSSANLGMFLDERLEELMQSRRKKSLEKPDFVLCTSQDLAPLLQTALGLERGFDNSKEFKNAYTRWDRAHRRASNVAHKF